MAASSPMRRRPGQAPRAGSRNSRRKKRKDHASGKKMMLLDKYELRTLDLEVEGLIFRLSLVSNTDELMEQLLAKGEDHEDVVDERIPYWADLWPSAIALSRYLLREGLVLPGSNVLEIGCGLALPGIVAGRLGGRVTLSDYLEEALLLARHNWKQNLEATATFRRMDWRDPDPALAADLVLASDVAYELRAFEPLARAFEVLCRPGGSIVVSEPNRAIARSFLDALQLEGFDKQRTVVTGRYDGLDYGVNIYRFRSHSST